MTVLGYVVEWFDPVSSILHTLFLKYFVEDNTLEIVSHLILLGLL